MTTEEALFSLAESFMAAADRQHPRWESLAMVVTYQDDVCTMSGLVNEKAKGAAPFLPDDADFDAADALHGTLTESGAPWVTSLFTIDRASGDLEVEFESEDPGRWEISAGTSPAPKATPAKKKKKKAAPVKKKSVVAKKKPAAKAKKAAPAKKKAAPKKTKAAPKKKKKGQRA